MDYLSYKIVRFFANHDSRERYVGLMRVRSRGPWHRLCIWLARRGFWP